MAEYAEKEKPDAPAQSPDDEDKLILEQARQRMKEATDENSDERKKQLDDLKFCTLDQWPAEIRAQREGDVNGNLPCLTIDQINQYIVQVVNDMKQNKPSIKARPVDDASDPETAEIFQGVIRQIEDQSNANVVYATAGDSAVKIGEGYFRFVTEYEDEKSFNQVIRQKRIPDTFCVLLGPHIMPDGSDAEWGFVFEDLPKDRFKRLYPKARSTPSDFEQLPEQYNTYWGDAEKPRVAEYFYFKYETKTLLFLTDGTTILEDDYKDLPEPKAAIATDDAGKPATRETQVKSIKWCKLTGLEVLEKQEWAGKYIPIVKVIGKESWVEGKRSVWGLVRPAKDSLRMYNYVASTIVQKFALSPLSPFVMAEGQMEGHEVEWSQANRSRAAALVYKPISVDGLSVPAPQRQQPAQLEAALYQFLSTTREDVKASLGMYKASVGDTQPNQSGKAILALTRESDTGTFHFSDNLNLSIQHGGRILVDLIPKIYDTKQILRILGDDGKVMAAEIDPNQPEAKKEVRQADGSIRKIYNLGVGTYDVTVTTGPSYNTKRMEAAALFTDLARSAKEPQLAMVANYLAVKNSDFNGSEQAADMLERLLPPNAVKPKDGQEIPPQIKAQMAQMQQAMQLMKQENDELKTGHREKMAKVASDSQAKQEQNRLDAAIAEEQARQNEIVAKREIELKEWVAKEEIRIKEEAAQREAALAEREARWDHAIDKIEAMHKTVQQFEVSSRQ